MCGSLVRTTGPLLANYVVALCFTGCSLCNRLSITSGLAYRTCPVYTATASTVTSTAASSIAAALTLIQKIVKETLTCAIVIILAIGVKVAIPQAI
jgi:hypothetical protein